jgi:hypothetical protein
MRYGNTVVIHSFVYFCLVFWGSTLSLVDWDRPRKKQSCTYVHSIKVIELFGRLGD